MELDGYDGIQLCWHNSGRCWLVNHLLSMMLQSQPWQMTLYITENINEVNLNGVFYMSILYGLFLRSSFDAEFNMCLIITTYSCAISTSPLILLNLSYRKPLAAFHLYMYLMNSEPWRQNQCVTIIYLLHIASQHSSMTMNSIYMYSPLSYASQRSHTSALALFWRNTMMYSLHWLHVVLLCIIHMSCIMCLNKWRFFYEHGVSFMHVYVLSDC